MNGYKAGFNDGFEKASAPDPAFYMSDEERQDLIGEFLGWLSR